MVARVAVFISLIAASLVGLAAPTSAAPGPAAAVAGCEGDGYAPRVTTSVHLRVTPQGANAKVTVTVAANDSKKVTGSVKVKVSSSDGTSSRTVAYNGKPVSIAFPTRAGVTYTIHAAFTPSDTTTHTCSEATTTYTAKKGVGSETESPEGPGGPGGGGPGGKAGFGQGAGTAAGIGGVLPNTGGPHVWWLLLGLLLVAGGSGAAVYARRSTAAH